MVECKDLNELPRVGYLFGGEDYIPRKVKLQYLPLDRPKTERKKKPPKKKIKPPVQPEAESEPSSPAAQRRHACDSFQPHYDQVPLSIDDRLLESCLRRSQKKLKPSSRVSSVLPESTKFRTVYRSDPKAGFLFRAPVPWHQQYFISKQFCEHNLFILHPVCLSVRKLWNPREIPSLENLAGLYFCKWLDDSSYLDIRDFASESKTLCDDVKTHISERWLKECSREVASRRSEWEYIAPKNSSDSMNRVDRFFRSLSAAMSTQLRHTVELALESWDEIFSSYLAKAFDDIFPLPAVTISASVVEQGLRLGTSKEELSGILIDAVDELIGITHGVPRLETVMLPETDLAGRYLLSVNADEDKVRQVKKTIYEVIETTYPEVECALRKYDSIFSRVETLVSQQIGTYLDGEHHFKLLDTTISNLKKMLEEIRGQPSFVTARFVSIDCSTVKKSLLTSLEDYLFRLKAHQFEQHRKITKSLAGEFEKFALEVNQVVEVTEDIVNLLKAVENHQTISMRRMKIGVARCGNRMVHLLNHMNFTDDDIFLHVRLFSWPRDLQELLAVSKKRLERVKREAEVNLRKRTETFMTRVRRFEERLAEFRNKDPPVLTLEDMRKTTASLDSLILQVDDAAAELMDINRDEGFLNWEMTVVENVAILKSSIEPFHRLWHTALDFTTKNKRWSHGSLLGLDYASVSDEIDTMYKMIYKLSKVFVDVPGPRRVAQTVRSQMEKFRSYLPLLVTVSNPGLRHRHWVELEKRTQQDMTKEGSASLSDLVSLGLSAMANQLSDIGETATKEAELEDTLSRMRAEWEAVRFTCLPYGTQGAHILGGTEDIRALLDEHLLRSQTMHGSPYIAPLEPELYSWEQTLTSAQDILDVWLQVQVTWLYLEPIFGSEDICRQMTEDGDKFSQIDTMWRSLMVVAVEDPRVLRVTREDGLLDRLRDALQSLQSIQRGLDEYLNKKRIFFPKFYFLSNDELLEILSKTKDPKAVERYLKRVLGKIDKLEFSEAKEIVAVCSESGERLPFFRNVDPRESKGMVELWLTEVTDCMNDSLKILLSQAAKEDVSDITLQLVTKYPNQILLMVILAQWTAMVEKALDSRQDLKETIEKYDGMLNKATGLYRQSSIALEKDNLGNIILLCMHLKGVTSYLHTIGVSSKSTQPWTSQLRCTIDDSNALLKVGSAVLAYGYEYAGNSLRPVITSQVVKVVRGIFEAVCQHRGVILYGETGCGKTEIVQYAADLAGGSLMTYNTTEHTSAKALLNVLSGAIQSGSWLSVHAVDRIKPGVLSVFAQTLENLFTTLKKGLRRFMIGSLEVSISGSCVLIFTTSEWNKFSKCAPDSLSSVFASINVRMDDGTAVVQGLASCHGFLDGRSFSSKFVDLNRCAKRKIKSCRAGQWNMLTNARAILVLSRRILDERYGTHNVIAASDDEEKICASQILQMQKPHISAEELPIFEGLLREKFPSCGSIQDRPRALWESLAEVIKDLKLVVTEPFLQKLVELHSLLQGSSAVIICGPACSGKSTLIKVLCAYYAKSENVEMHVNWLFSSAGTFSQIMGTWENREWSDGLVSLAVRGASRMESSGQQWIVLNGPMELAVLEPLDTLLDKDGKLSLSSGETIQPERSTKIVFETDGISSAPASTLSRCPTLIVGSNVISWKTLCSEFLQDIIQRFQPNEEIRLSFSNADSSDVSVSSSARPEKGKQRSQLKREAAMGAKSNSSSDSDSISARRPKPGLTTVQIQRILIILQNVLKPLVSFSLRQIESKLKLGKIQLFSSFLSFFGRVLLQRASEETVTNVWIERSFLFSCISTVGMILTAYAETSCWLIEENLSEQELKAHMARVPGEAGDFASARRIVIKSFVLAPEPHANFLVQDCSKAVGSSADLFRDHLLELIRNLDEPFTVELPMEPSLFTLCVDKKSEDKWFEWKDVTPVQSVLDDNVLKSVVCTQSLCRLQYFLKLSIATGKPLLVVGAPDSGKSFMVQHLISQLSRDSFVTATVQLTSSMTSLGLQKEIISRLDRRRKGTYGPPLGKRFVMFFDDLQSICRPDKTNKTKFEMIRMWLDRGSVVAETGGDVVELVDINVIAAIQAETDMDQRLLRYFTVVQVSDIEESQLNLICYSLLSHKWNSNSELRLVSRHYAGLFVKLYDHFRGIHCEFRLTPYHLVRLIQIISDRDFTDHQLLHRFVLHELQRTFLDHLKDGQDHVNTILLSFREEMKIEPLSVFQGQHTSEETEKLSRRLLFSVRTLDKGYSEIQSQQEYAIRLDQILEDARLKLIVCENLIQQTSKIFRILGIEEGHVMLVGQPGLGRRTAARVAACVLRMKLFEIRRGQQASRHNWISTVKGLLRQVGARGEATCFLLSEEQLFDPQFCLEQIMLILVYGEVPMLFSPEEKAELLELSQNMKFQRTTGDDSPASLYQSFTERVKTNLRLVLVFAEGGWISSVGLRMFPQLLKRSAVQLCHDWDNAALSFAAHRLIEEWDPSGSVLSLENKERCIAVILKIYREAQEISRKPEACHKAVNICIETFFDFVKTFTKILKVRRDFLESEKTRYLLGLELLDTAASQVEVQQTEMQKLQPKLIALSEQTDCLMVKIEQDAVTVEAQREVVAADGAQANEAAALAQAMKDECEADLADAIPALEAALAALDTLRPPDLTEIKTLKKPPSIVRLVMEAICVMLKVKPTRLPDMSGHGTLYLDYWPSSVKLLGDIKFMDMLLNYDRDRGDPAIMEEIRERFLNNPEFDPEVVSQVSVACEGLCRWVRGIEVYDRVIHIVGPKKAKLRESEKELARQMAILSEKHATLTQVMDRLQALNDDFAARSKKKKDLEDQIDDCVQKLQRSDQLLEGISGERGKWKSRAADVHVELDTVIGDSLFAASAVLFFGPYPSASRKVITQSWLQSIHDSGVPVRDNPRLTTLVSGLRTVRAWVIDGLADDRYTIDSAVIALNAPKCPLFLDPHGQVKNWLMSVFQKSALDLQILSPSDPEWIPKLAEYAEAGFPVLLEYISGDLDISLDDLLLTMTRTDVRLGTLDARVNDKFNLFLSTVLPDLPISFGSSNKVSVVNFELTEEGLESQLLSEVCSVISPRLEIRRRELGDQLNERRKEIRDLEDGILRVLGDSEVNILQDETAIKMLYASKILSEQSEAEQERATQEESTIDKQREQYRAVAQMARVQVSCLKRLSEVNPMYHWDVRQLFTVFKKAVSETEQERDRLVGIGKRFGLQLNSFVGQSMVEADRTALAIMLAREIQVVLSANIPRDRRMEKDPVTAIFGQTFVEKKTHNLANCLNFAGPRTPILVIVFSKSDPAVVLRQLAETQKVKSARLHILPLGEKQEDTATTIIQVAKAEGHWVILTECHLMSHWLFQLESLVLNSESIHSDFRLLLSSRPIKGFPRSVLLKSVKYAL